MRIPLAALRQYAADVAIPSAVFDKFEDMFTAYALRVAQAQRKKDQQQIRAWYFNQDIKKPQLFEVLNDTEIDG